MLLTIDIGNSHTVLGLFHHDRLIGRWRLQSDRDRTVDELAVQCHGLLSLANANLGEVDGAILASVVPVLERTWLSCLTDHLRQPPRVVSTRILQEWIHIGTDHPEEVGVDRLINGIAAWQRYRCNLVLIDFGTAITFDCVTEGGTFLGGAILPGMQISLEALATRTARLPRVDLHGVPPRVIGTSTIGAMQSGMLHGYGSLVDGLSQKMIAEMGCAPETCRVIATGGMAQLIAPYSRAIAEVDPLLTLSGLHFLAHVGMSNG